MKNAHCLVIALLAAGAGSGCARVAPYDREILSLRHMSPDGERVEDKFRQHWQESREGSAGGYAAAGGGCGCN